MKRTTLILILVALTLLIIMYLKWCRPLVKTDPLPVTEVNPAFEHTSPLARDVQVKKLEGNTEGNLIVIVDFGPGVIKDKYHALMVAGQKITLRDDGKGLDEIEGDGKFSVIIKEDLAAMDAALISADSILEKSALKATTTYKGRHIVPVSTSKASGLRAKFAAGGFVSITPIALPCEALHPVLAEFSLFITRLSVVEDSMRTLNPCTGEGTPGSAWTFERLITDMANEPVSGVTVQQFLKSFLRTWLDDQLVNGETIVQRDNLFTLVIRPWLLVSGVASADISMATWQSHDFNLAKAPFKLTAIVNRLDLRGNSAYGVTDAGEGRFIFEVLDTNCIPIPFQFNVIFEYGIPIDNCANLKAYGEQWQHLTVSGSASSPTYNTELQALTDLFALPNAAPSKPNGSAINQIRTNERALGSPWELREFNIDSTTHLLVAVTVKQEPAEIYNAVADHPGTPADVAELANWVNTNSAAILLDQHTVTEINSLTGRNFLGGKSHSQPGFWNATGITDTEARHHFSLSTCAGCHNAETGTPFVHLSSVSFHTESTLSGFITGISVSDPVAPATLHSFNDLSLRADKLISLICSECTPISGLVVLPSLIGAVTLSTTTMVH